MVKPVSAEVKPDDSRLILPNTRIAAEKLGLKSERSIDLFAAFWEVLWIMGSTIISSVHKKYIDLHSPQTPEQHEMRQAALIMIVARVYRSFLLFGISLSFGVVNLLFKLDFGTSAMIISFWSVAVLLISSITHHFKFNKVLPSDSKLILGVGAPDEFNPIATQGSEDGFLTGFTLSLLKNMRGAVALLSRAWSGIAGAAKRFLIMSKIY